ncbi:MAG: phage tail protein [Fusobacteriaceae bacterium]|nr:phage tail protein [Fusobacteriaceae bacterium]
MVNEKEFYKTILGDTWDLISFKIWGTTSNLVELMEANRDHIGTVFFQANVELVVPNIESKSIRVFPWR